MTLISAMMIITKCSLPTTDFATRYSTRYSDFLLQPYSNPTRSQKSLLVGACLSMIWTPNVFSSDNGKINFMFTEMIFLCGFQKVVNLQNKRSTCHQAQNCWERMINLNGVPQCHESRQHDSNVLISILIVIVLISRELKFLCDKSHASANTSGWGQRKADNHALINLFLWLLI